MMAVPRLTASALTRSPSYVEEASILTLFSALYCKCLMTSSTVAVLPVPGTPEISKVKCQTIPGGQQEENKKHCGYYICMCLSLLQSRFQGIP